MATGGTEKWTMSPDPSRDVVMAVVRINDGDYLVSLETRDGSGLTADTTASSPEQAEQTAWALYRARTGAKVAVDDDDQYPRFLGIDYTCDRCGNDTKLPEDDRLSNPKFAPPRQCQKCFNRVRPTTLREPVCGATGGKGKATCELRAGHTGEHFGYSQSNRYSGGQTWASLRTVAHDSGDGERIFHCPFCGSGQVTGRSDGTVECDFCFAGETEFITWDGVRTLKETVGTTQRVLVSTAKTKRSNGKSADVGVFGGRWVDAEIRSFGVQPLMKVTLRRNGREKVVYATPDHRWWTTPFVRNEGYTYAKRVVTDTRHLQSGDRLMPLFSQPRLRQNRATVPSPFGIVHGFVYGDGCLDGRGGSRVVLWGDKDAALLPVFSASRQRKVANKNGTSGIEVKDLPAFFKDRPSRGESLSYLYGWLAGYFAADGSVGKQGTPTLSSAKRENLEWVAMLCAQLGIGTYEISVAFRVGTGVEATDLYALTFVASTLAPEFFVIPEHRRRFEARHQQRDQVAWTVVSVEETDRVEEVYCAVVPEHENFTLAGNINVLNCKTHFTVQVQPAHANAPQTIDGQPITWKGQPDGSGPSSPGGEPQTPGEAAGADAGTKRQEIEQGDPTKAPFGEGDKGPKRTKLDTLPDEAKPKAKNPFAKSSSFAHFYITAKGHVLDAEAYQRHLAITYAEDRDAVLAELRGR